MQRALLTTTVLALAALSLGARSPGVEIEGDGVASTTSGGWGCGCGPIYRAKTIGGAGGIRVTERSGEDAQRDGEGVSVEARGALEHEAVSYSGVGVCSDATDPVLEPTCRDEASTHQDFPTRDFTAADVRVGFAPDASRPRDRWTIGVLGYADWVDMKPKANPAAPLLLFWPEIESVHVVGTKDDGTTSLVLGTGSPFASTLRRPALFYVGFRAETLRGASLTGVFGWFRAGIGLDDHDTRVDSTPSRGWASYASLLLGDPTFGFHARGSIPLVGGLAFVPSLGVGGLVSAIRGYGGDGTIALGLSLRL